MIALPIMHVVGALVVSVIAFAVNNPIVGWFGILAAFGLAVFYIRLSQEPRETDGLFREVVRDVFRKHYFNQDHPADSVMVWGSTAIFVIAAALAMNVKWLAPLAIVFALAAFAIHFYIWRGSFRDVRYELGLDQRIQRNLHRERANA